LLAELGHVFPGRMTAAVVAGRARVQEALAIRPKSGDNGYVAGQVLSFYEPQVKENLAGRKSNGLKSDLVL